MSPTQPYTMSRQLLRAIKRGCLLLSVCAVATAQAAIYDFSTKFPSCSNGNWWASGSTYTCAGATSLADGDTIQPAAGITVSADGGITLAGNNTIGSTGIAVNLQTSYGDIRTTGQSTAAYSIYGNLSSGTGAINLNITGDFVSGNISTGGQVSLTGGTVTGSVTGNNGVTTNGTAIVGDVSATSGPISLTGGSVTGGVRSNCCTVTTTNTNIGNGASSGSNTVRIDGGTIAGTISSGGGDGVRIYNVTMTSGSITSATNEVKISGSTIGSAASPVNVTLNSNNEVEVQNGSVVFGTINANNGGGRIQIDSSSQVSGSCTPANARCNAPTVPPTPPGPSPTQCGTGTVAGVVNTYYPVNANLAAGTTSIALGAATGAAASLAAGDVVLVMQMQGATIDTSNSSTYGTASAIDAGKYEYARLASVAGSTITLTSGLVNAYTYQAGSDTVAQRTIQVVRVPVLVSATLGSATALPWNGSTGGVLAFDVIGALNLNGATADVSGKGFRGGGGCRWAGDNKTNNLSASDYVRNASSVCPSSGSQGAGMANGLKGEGVAGTPRYVFDGSARVNVGVEGYPSGSTGRGAPANAGGGGTDDNQSSNNKNTGGGGGAGIGAGGRGGYAWSNATSRGRGRGGVGVAESPVQLTLGGGGGAGSTNDGTTDGNGVNSSGAAGGGIVLVRAGSLTGTGTFNANGADNTLAVGNDGSGGGGGGGAVLVSAGAGLGGLALNVKGGIGGTNTPNWTGAHGPGGGGGGGYAVTTSAPTSCSAAGGAAGTTNSTGDAYNGTNYGAMAGSVGSCVADGAVASKIKGQALDPALCAAPLDHVEFVHDGAALTCSPLAVTVLGCTGTASCNGVVGSQYSGSLSVTLGTIAGTDWCSDVNCATVLSGATTIANGQTIYLRRSNAGTARMAGTAGGATNGTIQCNNTTAPLFNATTACDVGFANAGFIVSVPAHYACEKQTVTIQAVQSSGGGKACTPAFGNVNRSIDLYSSYVNPTSGTVRPAFDYVINAAGGTAAVSALSTTAGTPTTLTDLYWDATGTAKLVNFTYADVGQVALYPTYKSTSGPDKGLTYGATSGNTFIAAPKSFVIGGITNPIKAGKDFTATVTAMNGCATPAATPNFGKETTAESVSISFAKYQPTGTAAVSGSFFDNGIGAFGNGAATASLNWSEVGTMDVTAALKNTSGYLGSGLSPTGTTGATGAIRSVPDHFETVVTQGCGTVFTYSGQPLTVVIRAMNGAATPVVTQNYDGTAKTSPNFAKAVTLSEPSGAAGSLSTTSVAASQFVAGTTLAAAGAPPSPAPVTTAFTFTNPLTAPATVKLRAADADGVSSAAGAEGTAPIRSGRLRLSNKTGPETLPLTLPIQAQYWSGAAWVINNADSCTSLPVDAFALSGRIFDAGNTGVSGAGPVGIAGGNGTVTLTAPSPATGSVAVAINLGAAGADQSCLGIKAKTGANVPWLRSLNGNCAATYDRDPSARATFGAYSPETRRAVHIRETY